MGNGEVGMNGQNAVIAAEEEEKSDPGGVTIHLLSTTAKIALVLGQNYLSAIRRSVRVI